MKTKLFRAKQFVNSSLVVLGLNFLGHSLLAQPVISYTISGGAGDYTLNFTVNNATPGTEGFDIYYWGVLTDGSVAGTPSAYASETFSTVHQIEAGDHPGWSFNSYWIDASYTHLPTGSILSGFEVLDTDATPPASIPYFAFGENGGAIYTGPDNHNVSNPSNPIFLGYAVTVPEPAPLLMVAGAWLLVALFRRRSVQVE